MLNSALLDSRQRWQDFAILGADFLFETDQSGCFTFLTPDPLLGHRVEALIGRDASALLTPGAATPFRLDRVVRDLKVWAQRADGSRCCLSLNVSPLWDLQGRRIGTRGTARDVTVQEAHAVAAAAALRRMAAFDHVVRRVRGETSATDRVLAALGAVLPALGCEGAAVIDRACGTEGGFLHAAGAAPPPGLEEALRVSPPEEGLFLALPAGATLALMPQGRRVGRVTMLAAWRPPGARAWDQDDRELTRSISELLRALLGAEVQEHELERQARTDALTGLLNRRAFMADLSERMARVGATGSLMFLDLDNFKPLNDALGHEAGDAALRAVAAMLRDVVRPIDLVARLGGDEFAVWLDGASSPVARARAQAMLSAAADSIGKGASNGDPVLSLSIGIAVHAANGPASPDALLGRADARMYAAKRAGRGRWSLDEAGSPS